MGESVKIIEPNESENEILTRVIRAIREAEAKDLTPDRIIGSLVEDSIHQIEIKLALENEFFDFFSDFQFIIDDKDMSDILKMTIAELALYLEKLISKNNFNK